MIVVFLVVLVVFGPQKLPELARTFGKWMAEFRKASNDFKSAFEEEMRDLERQARIAELKKQVAEATAAANTAMQNSAASANANNPNPLPYGVTPVEPIKTEATEAAAGSRTAEAPVVRPVAESIPRLDGNNGEGAAAVNGEAAASTNGDTPTDETAVKEAAHGNGDHANEPSPTTDQQHA
jgi:sec-independent protein translocase protein TatB